jgi:hypothetical protein
MPSFRSPDGRAWSVEIRSPGASHAMVVFHPGGVAGRGSRYAWQQWSGPEARIVTARLTTAQVADSLTDRDLARLFRRSMIIAQPVPSFLSSR